MPSFYLNYDGKTHNSDKLLISPNNRSFRYGDGCFETMKMINGKILLRDLHFERLFSSLETLKFDIPAQLTADALEQQVIELARKNGHKALARIRLMFFRGDGGLYDDDNRPHYLVQTWQMNPAINTLNDNGLVTGIFPDARKACDMYSPLKNNNYLCYAMAALWAKEQKLNDALVLNAYERIADSSIANIFIVSGGVIKTPAITEGCVAGVTRRYLVQCCHAEGIPIEETSITVEDIMQAQELFLTNAGYGIRWVKSCGVNNYRLQAAKKLFNEFIHPLYK
ncbi:MAG TPA: aminotransferase class IV [Chitinophagaceae bacterium]|nr:aminotransferase class IV [Chitinophagaceae bacterium]